ncbi:restriction endonuclease subunit S [Halobacterium salinarum]|uniref:restriction endonuclease subunit S n=1 Tax=Halobacterium salinarum TaxID=2242 RepID=UPI002552BDC3|nr:restriction endonuclease subunit S [Halobacterium salinarum]MDL0130060.1 restriction endonuclease subunit S [Halobacterium salinarum]
MSEQRDLEQFASTASSGERQPEEQESEPSDPEDHGTARYPSLPTDWEIKRLDEVATVQGGSTPSTDEEEYWGGEIPWATPTDLTELRGNTISDTEDLITEAGLESTSTHILPPYSVLLTSRAGIGKCAVNTVPMATNQGFQSLIPGEELNTWYLYYVISEMAPYLESIGSGSTFSEISKREVQRVQIPVPSMEEQIRIATTLKNTDNIREVTKQLVEHGNRIKVGLRQRFFTAGINGEELVETDSRYGKLPKSWSIKQLDDVTEVVGGSTPSTDEDEYWGGDIPWVTPTEVTELVENEISKTERNLTESGLESTSTHVLPVNSVLMTSRATIGECAVNTVPMATNQGFKSFIPGETLNTWYLYYCIEHIASYIESIGAGSTFSEVSKRVVKNIEIPVPSLDEQEEIAQTLKSVDDAVLRNKRYLSQMNTLKSGLMREIFHGRTRIRNGQIEPLNEVRING